MPFVLEPGDHFSRRHIGPSEAEISEMLEFLGFKSLDEFTDSVVPSILRSKSGLDLPAPVSESELLRIATQIAKKNKVFRSLIGLGYSDCITPGVIQRNIFENPAWYTQYTPYQAEISQGRLQALLNYQTMIIDLTGFPIANASLLDEATAAAEAMQMFFSQKNHPDGGVFLVAETCHPQTIAVVRTRAKALGIRIEVGNHNLWTFNEKVFGCLVQYPATDGAIYDYSGVCERAHTVGAYIAVAADPLALTLLTPPAEFGADAAVGSTQRFGVPLGFGGPSAAYLATTESFKRLLPGRIIGLSVDALGDPALRMALQTREQHIRREKATSNICTSQVLLAVMAGMYGVYYGPEGLKSIAKRIHGLTATLATALRRRGWKVHHSLFFDTIRISHEGIPIDSVRRYTELNRINLRYYGYESISISLDEVSDREEIELLYLILTGEANPSADIQSAADEVETEFDEPFARTSGFMTHPVFNSYHSETEMLRYIRSLEEKDLSLAHSMIPLGSCTMKLNATAEMLPVTLKEFSVMHPFAPTEQAAGYAQIFSELSEWLAEITGMDKVSLQPNSGAQGEYTGLLVIRAHHEHRGEGHRTVCLIPASAHGTNPASAVMAGFKVIVVKCDENGNVDLADLRARASEYKDSLGAFMITYPSTHGVFEAGIREMCAIVHEHGGQVYMDGANLNAQVGLMKPADLGADVCHINLHKTFCIPHGGGGPGMGPIAVSRHLAAFLPGHPLAELVGGEKAIGPVAASPWGSASILLISWAYIAMMGAEGLTKATKIALLNANYMSERLNNAFPTLYRGPNGRVAHEFIADLRPLRVSAGIEAEDIAKRLMDYGFHAPTLSFPVAGTLMIEPTESESKAELDRYCEALLSIREEIREVETGMADKEDNLLKNAPHTLKIVVSNEWTHPYERERAAFPNRAARKRKFWPTVGRVNNAYGDRNLICACPPVEEYAETNR